MRILEFSGFVILIAVAGFILIFAAILFITAIYDLFKYKRVNVSDEDGLKYLILGRDNRKIVYRLSGLFFTMFVLILIIYSLVRQL